MSRSVVAAALMTALAASACVPPEESIRERFADDRGVAAIRSAGTLTVAIAPPRGPLAAPSALRGIARDVSDLVAATLGVELEVVPLDEAEFAKIRAGEGTELAADLVFVPIPLTERLMRTNAASDPYVVSHHRVLVAGEGPVDSITSFDDLAGMRVCGVTGPSESLDVAELLPDAAAVGTAERCARRLRSGAVDAVVAGELVLYDIGTLVPGVRVVGEDLTTEGYGAVVRLGTGGLASFVDAVIAQAIEDGTWTQWYEARIAPAAGVAAEAPELSAEEAAALYPIGVPLAD